MTSALLTSLVVNNTVSTFSLQIFRYFHIYFLKNEKQTNLSDPAFKILV